MGLIGGNVRYKFVILSFMLLLTACSSSKKKEVTAAAALNDFESAPFEGLQTVRVLLTVVSKSVDQNVLRKTIVEEFEKIGKVYTPEDTSLEKLEQVQNGSFAIVSLNIKNIATSNFEKVFPVLAIDCVMSEEAELSLNNKKSMCDVWKSIRYIEVDNTNVTTREAVKEIKNLISEFAKSYSKANPQKAGLEIYVGNPIE
jgi:hypothetical protein